jgi:hypothetical protein
MDKAAVPRLRVIQNETNMPSPNEEMVTPEKELAVAAFSLLHAVANLDEMVAGTIEQVEEGIQEEALSLLAVSLRLIKKADINIADALMFLSSDLDERSASPTDDNTEK